MKTMLRKAFNDLRSSPGRTGLAIVALAVGLWGLGAMLVSFTVLTRDLSENFARTRPPHATLVSEDFGRLDLAALRGRREIESAELRDLSLQRIEARPGEWIPLWLFGVEDFTDPALALVRSEQGRKVPPPGTMLIERDGRLISELDVGSVARVRGGGRLHDVPVSGIAFDAAQAPATQDHFIYAYVDKRTYAELAGESANRRLIVRLNGVRSRSQVEAALRETVAYLESQGIRISSQTIPKLGEHPHQWQLDTLLFLQGGIGLLAFLMGAVLVSQLMASILARQVREIGIMKAIGATGAQVLGIYSAMVLALGIAAGTVAIPLAVATGYSFSYFVAGKLNFDILTRHLPMHLYLALGAASLLLPLALSLPAILEGMRLSVHAALGDYGLPPAAPSGLRPTAASPAPRWLLLAARNSLRQRKRLAVTVSTMALGVAIFGTGFNVRESLAMLLADFDRSMGHDVQVVLAEQAPRDRALSIFRGIPGVARIETWNGGRGELQSRVVGSDGIGIVALPYDTDLFRPRVVEGRWLHGAQAPEIVMNQQAAELLGNPPLESGQVVRIAGSAVAARLVGVIEELEKAKIYIDQAQYDRLANPEGHINSLMFVAKDTRFESVMALKRDVEAAIASTDLNVLYVMSQAERVRIIRDHLDIVLAALVLLSFLVLVVSALGMASAMAIGIQERTREIGVLRAVGAAPRAIFRLFVAEGMIVTGASVALGLLLAFPLSMVASVFFGRLMLGEGATLRYAFSGEGLAVVLAVSLVFGWMASGFPARRAVAVPTRVALSHA